MRISSAKHLGILAFGWLLLVIYAYPGLMTMDSIDQLEQARAGFYTDAHPPAMSALWALVDAIIPGPFGMFVLQTIPFIAGIYLLLRRAFSETRAAIATVALLLLPPVFTPMTVIWKDSLMAGLLALGAAALLSERRRVRVAGLFALMGATAVRYNAPAATLPLVVLLFTWKPMRPWKRYGVALLAWFAITLGALGLGTALTDRKMYIWHSSLALMDIAGTLSHVDGTLSDEQLRELLRGTEPMVTENMHARLRSAYRPRDFVYVICCEHQMWTMPIWGTDPAPEAKREAVSRAWWETLTTYPGAYLASRLATMRHVLAIGAPPESTVMIHKLQLVDRLRALDIDAKGNGVQRKLQRALSRLATGFPSLFRPWIYCVLALAMLGFCLVRDRTLDVIVLLLSGLGMEASLFVLAASPDYRYSHWLVVCVCVAAVIIGARRFVLHRSPGG